MTTLMQDNPARNTVTSIPGFSGTPTHRLGITLYLEHHDRGDGRCARCGAPHPCDPRLSAREVITAAGEEPRRYDPPFPSPGYRTAPPADPWRTGDASATTLLPVQPPNDPQDPPHEGFHINNPGRPPQDPQGYEYDRNR
jgi:hypothetical protein